MNKHSTREAWLLAAIELMKPHFSRKGHEVPEIRVSCGWPDRGGTSQAKRVIGQCWSTEAASDGISQIFISPYLNESDSEQGILATLVHEVVHAVVGTDNKHNKVFRKCALAVGLDGPMTATVAGEELIEVLRGWTEELGAYPHGRLDRAKSPVKKQGTRMIKCTCEKEDCGYTCRTTKKWLLEVGAPHCPKHGAMSHDPIEGSDDD